ncbi:ribonuclease H-like domain-containing protein, partial [Tanacetum coccineum]
MICTTISKIVEQKVKKTVGTSSGGQNLAFMTAPSSSSTNDANTACSQVSAASPSVNTTSPQVCTASVSDNTVYAFMVENPNGSNVLHQDLEQIHEDDLEAMDLKWQLSLLSVRAKKYYQRTGKKIFINGNDIAGYDKSKVECYNYHKLGHFARECRAPRSKEGLFRNQDNTRKQGNNEDTSKAMLAIDGVGFDWSDMAEEQVQTNMALMAFLDSGVYTDKTCSKTCLKNYKTLKKQYDDLLAKLHQTKFKATTYKRGLDTVEAQLVTYRKNEVLFGEEVVVLKRKVGCKQYEIDMLKTEFENVKQEKDGIDFKIEKFEKASKDLDQLLGSQTTDKSKKGLGYSAVPLPHPLIYNRPNKLDLSYSGLDEFKEPEFKGYSPENSKQKSNVVCENELDNSKENYDKFLIKEQVSQDKSSFVEGYGPNTSNNVSEVEPKKVRKNDGAPIIEDWVLDDEEQDESKLKSERNLLFLMLLRKSLQNLKIMKNQLKSKLGQVNAVRVKGVNAVKSSAYWVWRPTKSNSASLAFKRHNYIDARGRSKASHNMMIKDLLTVDDQGMDKSKITRKQSKASKHGHENQKSTKRSQRIKAEARKVKPQSNPVKEKPIISQQKSTRPKQIRLRVDKILTITLDGEARDWLDKEPPRSILTWDDLVSKFINQYFPPSKTTYYRNEIITFYQKPNEAFNEAWERFKGLLRQCPHHGFSELHQLDTFYNSLNSNDQDALDSAAGGNFLDKMPQEGLAIIESKSKVRYSRSRANDSRVSTDAPLSNSSPSNNSFDMQQIAASLEDKMTIKMNQMMNDMKALVVTTPVPVKAVEEVCVTCGSNHNFNLCPLTRGGNNFPVFHDNIQQFQQTAAV